MFIEVFDYINTKFGHDFVSYHPLKYYNDFAYKDFYSIEFDCKNNLKDIYHCTNCNEIIFTYAFHPPKDFDNGVEFNGSYYEMYNSLDENDVNYIDYLDFMKCDEQIIKNLLE